MIPETLDSLAVPINDLTPYEQNPRQGDISLIAESLERNGQYRPIVVNKRGNVILAGNHTFWAAKELGWSSIAATFVDADEETARRIVLIDNRANDLASYDDEALAGMIQAIVDAEGPEGLIGTGFDTEDLDVLLGDLDGKTAEESEDAGPAELPDNAITKPGDVWTLGDHRLICGDSTDQATVEKLMNGSTADLLLTDPPYGVSYSEKNKDVNRAAGNKTENLGKSIANDELTGGALATFLEATFSAGSASLKAGGSFYCFHADSFRIEFETALQKNGLATRQTLLWLKHRIGFGRQDYQWQHEPILYGWKEGAAHSWYGGRDKSTVIEHDRPAKSDLHPTTKPVGLLSYLIENSTTRREIVLDLFGGSGSTLIAAEQTGRASRLIELDPAYCDVICRRFQETTGIVPVREADGKPRDFTA